MTKNITINSVIFVLIMTAKKWFESWFDTPYYHTLYKHRDFNEAESFINNLIKHFDINNTHNCLDLACGKGRHSIYLNKQGIQVTGVDLSEQSILAAKQFENDSLSFYVHDMRAPAWSNAFDFIFNLFTSFGYFENEKDNYKTIANMAMACKKDGYVIIDFMNSIKVIKELIKQEAKTIDGITFNITRQLVNGFITKNIQFRNNEKDFSFQEKVQALKLSDFENYLFAANLKIVDIFGGYNLSDFKEHTSDRLIIIAKKQ